MHHLLSQLQQKLQLDYKSIIQVSQKIELYRSPTTKDLKKPHSSRWIEGGGDAVKHGDAE